jgi:hypothetical protein
LTASLTLAKAAAWAVLSIFPAIRETRSISVSHGPNGLTHLFDSRHDQPNRLGLGGLGGIITPANIVEPRHMASI